MLGHGGDLGHELFAAELALLHLGELVFPLAGELGLGQFLHVQPAQERHELEGLGSGNQLAAFAQHVLLGNQAFDDAGAGGWCAQALLLHGFAQLVVFHGFAGTFHGAEQRGFGVAGWGFGFEALGFHGLAAHLFIRGHGHQILALVAVLGIFHFGGGFLAVDGQPAGLDQYLAFGFESVLGRRGDAGGHLVFRTGEEHRHEAAHHQVVQLLFRLAQATGRLQGGDDGKVIRHLGVVEHAFCGPDVVAIQCDQGVGREVAHVAVGQHLEGLFHHRHIVFRQGAGIGTRVGQGLVALVEALGNLQGGLGGEAELAVGFALQAGQVKQQGGSLRGGLALFCDRGLLAAHGVGYCPGFCQGPDAVGLLFSVVCILLVGGVEPLGRVLTGLGGKGGVYFPIVAAHKLADQLFALDHHGQGGRLHPSHGGQEEAAIAAVECRHGAGAVDAYQPVGLRAAAGGIGQGLHLGVGAQILKAIADGLGRHGLQPQAAHRLAQGFGATGVLLNQAEDQLPFASRVTGVDDFVHVLALGQFDHGVQARLGLVDWLEVEVRRDHRQVRKAPLAALDVILLRGLDLDQVAYGAGDDIGVAFEVLIMFLKLAGHRCECTHDVLGDRRLFRNN